LGWIFVRIRGSLFFRDPDRAVAPVFAKLEQLGIEPAENTSSPAERQPLAMVERIRRRAEAIRREWREEKLSAASGHYLPLDVSTGRNLYP
jgi:hypothetical protein